MRINQTLDVTKILFFYLMSSSVLKPLHKIINKIYHWITDKMITQTRDFT